jgi:acyl transferase domain-containing protein
MAIVGVALNLPNGVNTLAALAHASAEAQDTVRALPDARRDDFLKCCDLTLAQRLRAIQTINASFLDHIDLFCPEFFSVSI